MKSFLRFFSVYFFLMSIMCIRAMNPNILGENTCDPEVITAFKSKDINLIAQSLLGVKGDKQLFYIKKFNQQFKEAAKKIEPRIAMFHLDRAVCPQIRREVFRYIFDQQAVLDYIQSHMKDTEPGPENDADQDQNRIDRFTISSDKKFIAQKSNRNRFTPSTLDTIDEEESDEDTGNDEAEDDVDQTNDRFLNDEVTSVRADNFMTSWLHKSTTKIIVAVGIVGSCAAYMFKQAVSVRAQKRLIHKKNKKEKTEQALRS